MNGIVVVVFVVLAIIVWLVVRERTSRADRYCHLFKLDPSRYTLMGTDLGGSNNKIFLRGDGLVGVPDALFTDSKDGTVVVGEAKSRRLGRRRKPSAYEFNQVQLYLGLAARRYRRPVRGLIRYRCGSCLDVPYEPAAYRHLVAQLPAFRAVARRIGLYQRRRPRRRRARN